MGQYIIYSSLESDVWLLAVDGELDCGFTFTTSLGLYSYFESLL